MNKSDSERISAVLELAGGIQVAEKEADLIVVNACTVRQKGVDRIFGKVHNWNKNKMRGQDLKTVLTGCVLPADQKKMNEQFDFVFNIKELNKFAEFIGTELDYDHYLQIKPRLKSKFYAFVPIMTGCNNFCSYCAVPYVRGREKSRPMAEILQEVRQFVMQGAKHITLLGQNVNSYEYGFAELLRAVHDVDGVKRLEFTSSHPKDMTDEVIACLALPKMMNHFHLPLQAGDDQVLQKMNRDYTCADYLKLIEKIRNARPCICIGTDIIVGFPGETKEQFENTFEFFKKIKFDNAYIAKYSPRPGSKAAELEDDVSYEEKNRRWNVLEDLLKEFIAQKNQSFVGREAQVLVDKIVETHGNAFFLEGESRDKKRIRFKAAEELFGQEVNVKITKALQWGLFGIKKLKTLS